MMAYLKALSSICLRTGLRTLLNIYADDITVYERIFKNQDDRNFATDLSFDLDFTDQ